MDSLVTYRETGRQTNVANDNWPGNETQFTGSSPAIAFAQFQ